MFLFSDVTHWAIGMEILPNKNFPLIFDSIDGLCEQEAGNTSYYNSAEVNAVIGWIT